MRYKDVKKSPKVTQLVCGRIYTQAGWLHVLLRPQKVRQKVTSNLELFPKR